MLDITSDNDLKRLLHMLDINVNQIQTKDNFKGKVKNGFYICNLDKKTGQGTHWTAFYCHNKYIVYFDSFGLAPPRNIINFCNKTMITYSTDEIQDINSNACGYYCIAFIKYFHDIPKSKLKSQKLLGFYLNNFLKPFNVQYINKNEKILETMLKEILNKV